MSSPILGSVVFDLTFLSEVTRQHGHWDNLIPRNALLDAMEDDDDIEWKEDPFDRPHRAEPESPEELLAMIQFEGMPALGPYAESS